MAFDVSALTAYIENGDFPIIGKIQVALDMTSGTGVEIVKAVKGDTKLHFAETDVIFQSGGGCARTAAGTTTRTDLTLTAGRIAIAEDLCFDDLAGKWDQTKLKQGLLNGIQTEPDDFAKWYFDEKTAKMKQAIEIADWQGDTASGAANYNKYNGLIKLIDAGSPVDGNTSNETSVTTSNIITIMDNMFLAIPTNLKFRTDLVCYIPFTWFQMYGVATKNANYFASSGGQENIAVILGTTVKLIPTYGLTAGQLTTYGRMFLTYPSNFVLGLDAESDENFSARIDPVTNKKLLVDALFTRGWQVKYTADVVEFTIHGS
jgi:hypothetical protein